MNCLTQSLNTAQLNRRVKAYITDEIHALLEQSIRTDHLLIQEEDPNYLHLSLMVTYKLDKVIEQFYSKQSDIVTWFHRLELGLQNGGRPPITHLGFEGNRINRNMIQCDSLKPATLKKMLDNAKDYAVRKVLPDKKKYTTGDVLSFYFHEYTRDHMFDFKLECARKLKEIHREVLERPPLDPLPLNDMDYEELFRATRSWLDDNEFGIDVGITNTCSSSYLPPFPAAANPTKKLRVFDDLSDCEVDF
jgi:hypothetical protein